MVQDLYLKLLTLAINQNAHRRAVSSEGNRVSLYEADGATGSEESMPKPGTPGNCISRPSLICRPHL